MIVVLPMILKKLRFWIKTLLFYAKQVDYF